MTEPAKTPAPEPEAPSAEDQVIAALGIQPPTAEPDESEDDDAPPPAAAKPKPAPAKSDPGKPKPKRLDVNTLHARLRKAEEAAAKKDRELADREARIAQQEARGRALDKLGSDPLEALNEAAKAAGLDPEAVMQRLVERKLHQGAPGPHELRQEIEKARAEAKQVAEQMRKERDEERQQQGVAYLESQYNALLSIQRNEELGQKWPHLGSMHPVKFEEEMRQAVEWAAQKEPGALQNIVDFANRLEKAAELEYRHQSETLSRLQASRSGLSGNGKNGALRGTSDSRSPEGRMSAAERRTVTNDDSADNAGAPGRDLSERQRSARAEQFLIEQLSIARE